jgi:hypothetical protein
MSHMRACWARRAETREPNNAFPGGVGAPRLTCYFTATGFTGEPTAWVNGCGVASSRNS